MTDVENNVIGLGDEVAYARNRKNGAPTLVRCQVYAIRLNLRNKTILNLRNVQMRSKFWTSRGSKIMILKKAQ